jgi:alpha-beta hydrolase superfamily lysophospholipase
MNINVTTVDEKPAPFETNLQTRDGLQLYIQSWDPAGEIEATVCLIHGLGEHSGRYGHVANFFNRRGLALIALDLRGHGKSQGKRGHSPSFAALMDDTGRFLEEAAQRYPEKPLFLYGHSLGGLLALNYVLRRKPDLTGVIVTGAGLYTSLTEQTGKLTMVKLFGAVLPKVSISTGLDARILSRDPDVVEAYLADPLVHYRTTLSMARTSLRTIPWVMRHAHEFTLSLLLMNGTEDHLTFPQGSEVFADRVQGDCTLKLWPGLYHEIHNEPEKEQVLQYMVDWLKNRL